MLQDVSADGRLAVLNVWGSHYRLVEFPTGRELARLEDADRHAHSAVFTPDGTRLVGLANTGVVVWDLRRLRAGLAELGLDWDAPPYPPAPPAVPRSEPA